MTRCLLLLLGGLLALPAPAQAAFPGKNGRIAFGNKVFTGPSGVTTMEAEGTFPHEYLSWPAYGPAWSPDGTRLAFEGETYDGTYGLFTMNYAGGDVRPVLTNSGSLGLSYPSWSPDGAQLAFTQIACWYACSGSIHIVNVDGSGERSLFQGEFPAWSPDGSKIAFDLGGEITTMDVDGQSDHVNLTNSAPDDTHPNWSPDGSKIAFASNRDGNYEIYVMNADGTGQTRITNRAEHDTSPAWSPDGQKVAFESTLNNDPIGCGSDCQAGIFTMNADGSGQTRITPSHWSASDPDWQPVVGYPRPRNANRTAVSLVPAFAECAAPNAQHGQPLAEPSCSPITHFSDFLTVGAPDANGNAANSTGSVSLRVRSCPKCASPLPPDVLLTANLTDVRNRFALTDYTGELEAVLHLRITDGYNGPATLDRPATAVDTPFSFPMTCAATELGSVGSTCTTSTSANAVLPGLVRDFQRAIWQLGRVEVYDGGPDGDADTADNTLFAVQGLFAP